MKVVKKVGKIIFWILLIIIALYSVFIMIQKLLWKDKTPSFFGYKNFIVLTGSMEPTLNIGDIVVVKETTDIEEGDIISFRVKDFVVTHRVFEVYRENGKEYYITKGDANSNTDPELLNKENVDGKYCFKIPFLGRIIHFFQKPIGLIILFVMLGLALLLSSIKTNKNQKYERGSGEDEKDN